ncbi:MAG: sigma-70 family RNA polymerase sigma factor [Gemmatimonadota bacterium]
MTIREPEATDDVTVRDADAAPSSRREWFAGRVDELLPRLMGTALRLTKNRAEAEDLVAESLAKGWESLDSLVDPEALEAWLCRILTNTFVSRKRTGPADHAFESYEEACSDSEAGFSIFERLHQPFLLWQSNPEQDFLERLLREDLADAIDALPDVFRPAVVLVDVQGLSYKEAAEALGVPVGTVRSRLARGRSLLQEALWTLAVDAGYRKPRKPTDAGDEADGRRSPDEHHPARARPKRSTTEESDT